MQQTKLSKQALFQFEFKAWFYKYKLIKWFFLLQT